MVMVLKKGMIQFFRNAFQLDFMNREEVLKSSSKKRMFKFGHLYFKCDLFFQQIRVQNLWNPSKGGVYASLD